MMKNSVLLIAAVLLGVLLFTNNAASVPLEFTHQGRLMDGDNPANGFFDIEYGLYDAAVGGNLLWSETHNGVKVTDGLFIVELGTIATFFDVFTDPPPPGWLQIQIVGEATPISPRTKLSGSPYAILANGVSSSRPIPGSLDTAKIDMQTTSTGSSLRLRVVPTAQTTGRGVAMKATQQGGEIAIGDPDFDLLRMTGDATGADVRITGDPDFDLLRLSATADSGKIRISGQSIGDPDFDLLRISGGGGSGGSGGGEIAMTGDPDFDLLRMSANADSAVISMSGQDIGDPDFDLLRMIGRPQYGNKTMQVKNSAGTIRGITTEVDSATASYHYFKWSSGSVKRNMISMITDDETGTMTISNAVGTKGIASRANNSGGSIAIDEEGVQKIAMSTDGSSSSIAVNEEGTHNITISVDSGGPASIAVNEEGEAETAGKIEISHDTTRAQIAVEEEGIQIAISADSGGGGSFAINEPGVGKKVSFDSDGVGYVDKRFGIGIEQPTNPLGLASGAHCTVGGVFTNASDKNLKENFEEVNGETVLEKIESLDISEWNYKNESDDIKHIGPTAQDFYKAFGVGGDDKTISTVDPSGIALAAIKELYKKSKEVDDLKKQLDELTKAVEKLAKERK